jgi:amidase
MCAIGSKAAVSAGVFDPANATIEQLHAALDSRRTSSEQRVRYYLGRIQRFDKEGPRINALITLNPDALEEARQSDAKRADGHHIGFLEGIPFVAKDY